MKWFLIYMIMIQGQPAPVTVASYTAQQDCEDQRHLAAIKMVSIQRDPTPFAMVCVAEHVYNFGEK